MMHILLIYLLVFDGIGAKINGIALKNNAKSEAEHAYEERNYPVAISKFQYLLDTLKVYDENAMLNLAHSYYQSGNIMEASKMYERAYAANNAKIKSVAAQQLGTLSYKADGDKDKALSYYKEAIKANPDNSEARYNYELLKKMPEKKEEQKTKNDKNDKQDKKDDNQQNKDQKQDPKNGDNKDQNKQNDSKDKDSKSGDKKDDQKQGDKKDDKNAQNNGKDPKQDPKSQNPSADKGKDDPKKGDDKQPGQGKKDAKKEGQKPEPQMAGEQGKQPAGGKKSRDKIVANPQELAAMGLTQQRAQMLLDALKSNETQYLQQVKREPDAKSKNRQKPDW
ncbi:MAG: tetratricopeptide repeat protein [Cytophagales bacterium]|nr:tetratricopeptide repeat protein [Cytophagales bacterium]